MAITINGTTNTITGLAVGGLPNGVVDEDTLANLAVSTGKIANNAVTAAKATGVGGITVCDNWYLASSTNSAEGAIADSGGSGGGAWIKRSSISSSVTTVTTGSGGGRFSFPTTGFYLITGNFSTYHNADDNDMGISAFTTTNNFTSTTTIGYTRNTFNSTDGTPNAYHAASNSFLFDVTDISNCKFYWNVGSVATNNYVYGADTDGDKGLSTTCIITRLGDT